MVDNECRRYAAECLKAAELLSDQTSKSNLIEMAAAWLRLADLAEKNSHADLVYEAPYVTERAKP